MGRSRHGIIGPDDPSISYKDNLYSFVERVVKEYLDGFEPWRRQNRYVYVCNNPINSIDPLGLDMEYTGPKNEYGLQKSIEITGLPLVMDSNGKVEVGEGPRNAKGTSERAAERIKIAIGDKNVNVQINFDENQKRVLVGGLGKSPGQQKVDVDDLKAIERVSPAHAKAALIHEIAEAYGQGKEPHKSHKDVHKEYGIEAQNETLQDLGVNDERLKKDPKENYTSGKDGKIINTVEIEYKNSTVTITDEIDPKTLNHELKKFEIRPKQQP